MSAEVWEQAKREQGKMSAMLEAMMDKTSVETVADALREICYAKAQHVEENWQDSNLGLLWDKVGRKFDGIACYANQTNHPSFKAGR